MKVPTTRNDPRSRWNHSTAHTAELTSRNPWKTSNASNTHTRGAGNFYDGRFGYSRYTAGDKDQGQQLRAIRTSTNADFEEDSIGSLGTTEQDSYEEGITVGGKDINFREATFGINFHSHFNFGRQSIIRMA